MCSLLHVKFFVLIVHLALSNIAVTCIKLLNEVYIAYLNQVNVGAEASQMHTAKQALKYGNKSYRKTYRLRSNG